MNPELSSIFIKTNSIPYLSQDVLDSNANVNIVSSFNQDSANVNNLALAAWSSVFSSAFASHADVSDEFLIITEFAKDDIDLVLKFCHGGQLESCDLQSPIFKAFGISTLKSCHDKPEPLIENNDIDFDSASEEDDDNNDVIKEIKKLKMKRVGRPRKVLPRAAEKNEAPSEKLKVNSETDENEEDDPETLAKFKAYKLANPIKSYAKPPKEQLDLDRYKVDESKPYQCDMCIKRFFRENSLNKHFIVFHSYHYDCDYCPLSFLADDEHSFLLHMFRHEHVSKTVHPLRCVQCGYSTKNRRNFLSHVESKGPYHDDKCTHCSQVMNTYDEYKSHVESVHQGVWKLSCGICTDVFADEEAVKEHRKDVHRAKRRVNPTSYAKPKNSLLVRKPVESQVCDMCGVSTKSMKSHMRMYHTNENIPCDKCGLIFRSDDHLKNHMEAVHVLLPCSICGQMIPKKRKSYHMNTKHTQSENRKFKCEYCGKGFIEATRLNDHINTHTGNKPYVCKYCGVGFANRSNHGAHEKGHKGIKRNKSS